MSHYDTTQRRNQSTGRWPHDTVTEMAGTIIEHPLSKLARLEQLTQTQEARIAQLEAMAQTDELTGLLNRRGLMQSWDHELSAVSRDPAAGGVLVMFDLDNFKMINDRHGHAAGDAYLQQVGLVLCRSVRQTDVVARRSGDEFAVLLTRIGPGAGLARADKLAAKLNNAALDWQGFNLPINTSYGAEPYSINDICEDIMHKADAKLYRNKAARNQKPCFSELMASMPWRMMQKA